MNIAAFAVDPGGSTGLAWGIFNPSLEDVGDQLRKRQQSGSATVTGDIREQITTIADIWASFYNAVVRVGCLPPERVWFVCEDFIYTGANAYSGDSAKISTALIWGIEGYRMGRRDEWREHRRGKAHMPPMILQPAGDAKNFAKPERLKDWDVWIVGREHERSAFQHIAFFLKRYQAQHAN